MAASTKLATDIQDLINKNINSILEDIATKHSLDISELRETYLNKGDSTVVQEKKKRGRKKKQKDEFIETTEIEFEGQKYLVDNQNNVYTTDIDAPALIGEKLVDGTIKLFS